MRTSTNTLRGIHLETATHLRWNLRDQMRANSKPANHLEPHRWLNSLALFAIIAALCSGCAGDAQGAPAKDWSFLQNSYWYVPTPNLLAVLSTVEAGVGTVVPINDQTVFYIKNYQSGYFWGTVATELTIGGQPSGPTCFFLVGSVTPEGAVNLSLLRPVRQACPPSVSVRCGSALRSGKWKIRCRRMVAVEQSATGRIWSNAIPVSHA